MPAAPPSESRIFLPRAWHVATDAPTSGHDSSVVPGKVASQCADRLMLGSTSPLGPLPAPASWNMCKKARLMTSYESVQYASSAFS